MSQLHVAIVMDGNGRWAEAQKLPRAAGHREGARAVRRVVEAAPDLGISILTLYAFSSDNWRRPDDEVTWLMRLFRTYVRSERRNLTSNGVRSR
jgi:undecaprenyl diphosphate synthase